MKLPSPVELERVLVDAVDREPDSELIERPGWVQVRSASSRRANNNVVVIAQLAPNEVRAVVDEVDGEHRARGAKYRWVIGPSSAPPELEAALLDRGLRSLGVALGMARTVPAQPRGPALEGLTIAPATASEVELYASVTTRGWERGREFEEAVRHIAGKTIGAANPATISCIARLHGEPVATSHLRLLPALGYMQGAAVLPDHRRKGIYAALLHHRLAVLREHDLDVAVIWADAEGSARVCGQHGFVEVARAKFFEVPYA